MEPVKIAGLTLKSEPKTAEVEKIIDAASENLPVPEPIPDDYSNLPTIEEEIITIIKRVEDLPKSDTNIKALAKLKGALELLA